MKKIKLSDKDWKALMRIIKEAETKARPKLKKLIKDNYLNL